MGRRRGYSLIEVVMVLAIAGILAGVGALRYSSSLERARLESAARRLIADLDHARDLARRSGQSVRIQFNPAQSGYRISGGAHVSSVLNTQVFLNEDPYRVRIASADFDGASRLDFNGYGEPLAGGSIILRTARNDGTARKIIVDHLSLSARLE